MKKFGLSHSEEEEPALSESLSAEAAFQIAAKARPKAGLSVRWREKTREQM